jgi:Zn-dependent protease
VHVVAHVSRLAFFVALVPSVILHEVSHGVVALAFGDDTAKRAGRLTLNPVAHVDPFGTLVLPLLMIVTTGAAFGYAKPVPVNVRALRNPRQQAVLVSLVGPVTNIALAVAAAVVLRVARPTTGGFLDAVFTFGFANVILAAFNLIPLPPLDGSAIIERVMPTSWWPRWFRLRQYSMGILLIVVFLLPGTLSHVFNSAVNLWARLLPR